MNERVFILVGELAGRDFAVVDKRSNGNGRGNPTTYYAIRPPAGLGPGERWWYSEYECELEAEANRG